MESIKTLQRRTGWVMEMEIELVPNAVRLGNPVPTTDVRIFRAPPYSEFTMIPALTRRPLRATGRVRKRSAYFTSGLQLSSAVPSSGSTQKPKTLNSKLLSASHSHRASEMPNSQVRRSKESACNGKRIFGVGNGVEVRRRLEGVVNLLRCESNLMHFNIAPRDG